MIAYMIFSTFFRRISHTWSEPFHGSFCGSGFIVHTFYTCNTYSRNIYFRQNKVARHQIYIYDICGSWCAISDTYLMRVSMWTNLIHKHLKIEKHIYRLLYMGVGRSVCQRCSVWWRKLWIERNSGHIEYIVYKYIVIYSRMLYQRHLRWP